MTTTNYLIFFVLLLGCKGVNEETYSFKLEDYTFIRTQYSDEKEKLGNLYQHKNDKRLTLRKTYYDNDALRTETFYLNDKRCGPHRYYDYDGKTILEQEIFYDAFGKDSVNFRYDRQTNIMKRINK